MREAVPSFIVRTTPTSDLVSHLKFLSFRNAMCALSREGSGMPASASAGDVISIGTRTAAKNLAVAGKRHPLVDGTASKPQHPGVAGRHVASAADCFRSASAARVDPFQSALQIDGSKAASPIL